MAGILDLLNGAQGGLLDFLRNNALNQAMPSGLASDMADYGPPPLSLAGTAMPKPAAPQIAEANQPSPLDTAQWPAGPIGAPSNANAQMPSIAKPAPFSLGGAPAAPAGGGAPAAADLAAPPSPGFGDRLSASLSSIQHTPGIIPALFNGIAGFATGQRTDEAGRAQSANERWLASNGVDPGTLAAVRGDPQLTKKLVQQTITQRPLIAALKARGASDADIAAATSNPEFLKAVIANNVKEQDNYRPATAQERAAAGMTGDNNTPMFVNQTTNEPKFGPAQTNVNVSTEKTGQAELAKTAVEEYKNAQLSSKESQKRIAMYDAFENAAQGFTPGATAEMRLTAKRYLKDAGLIKGDDVPDGEIQQMIGRQLAIHAQPKGQGAVSNYERELYASALPSMIQSPEGLRQAIAINRKLEQFDMKVAQIWRESAAANRGIPNYLDVQNKIADLGSPLSPSDMAAIQPAGRPAPAAPAPTAASAPDRAAIEAEIKRRGLK